MGNVEAVVRFAELARAYCDWVEGAPGTATQEMACARRHLAGLYAHALELPQVECVDVQSPAISHETWLRMFQRFDVLPVRKLFVA